MIALLFQSSLAKLISKQAAMLQEWQKSLPTLTEKIAWANRARLALEEHSKVFEDNLEEVKEKQTAREHQNKEPKKLFVEEEF